MNASITFDFPDPFGPTIEVKFFTIKMKVANKNALLDEMGQLIAFQRMI
jgi:hypothetical protein